MTTSTLYVPHISLISISTPLHIHLGGLPSFELSYCVEGSQTSVKVANTRLPVSERQLTDSFRKPTFSSYVLQGRRQRLGDIRGFLTDSALLEKFEDAAAPIQTWGFGISLTVELQSN